MFRQFAGSFPGGASKLFQLHPAELAVLLEQAWEFRIHDDSKPQGHPEHRSNLPGLPRYLLKLFDGFTANEGNICRSTVPGTDDVISVPNCVMWDHLIYAYMVENTRIYEIFREVLRQFRNGELLGVPIDGAENWLRNTEELFYKDPPSYSIFSFNSHIRPQFSAIRRNAYFRMFGMELNHKPSDDVSYEPAKASNNEFVVTFEEFLRQVWVGIVNVENSSGSNPTDNAEIANLAEKLHDMLITRRLGSNLAREELFFVSMFAWFHLSMEFDSPIVKSLRAEGTSPEQRLHKIAQRVSVPAHAFSKNFFDIADAASRILTQIETGTYNDPQAVPALYTPVDEGPHADIRTIITHWSITTGHDLKSRKVVAT
ncbi:MAG: hypothetical protein OEZ68_12425 [Gammaproteobacteria bacterium]|nr:hypothetical protein [Gammaproteobacteria bacterium]MDH5801601.1 hypothetical protein [Gammaproteobacteria bacterium]